MSYSSHFLTDFSLDLIQNGLNKQLISEMSKRSAEDSQTGGSSGPQCKKVQFEPIRLGAISSLEEMDMKVLQFQNKKLSQVKFEYIVSYQQVLCQFFIL